MGESIQAIFGTASENLKTDMERFLKQSGQSLGSGQTVGVKSVAVAPSQDFTPELKALAERLVAALGGRDNIKSLEPVAMTRIRVEVKDATLIHVANFTAVTGLVLQEIKAGLHHVIVGSKAESLARIILRG